ncbi:MAG: ABC transporter permease, partial [Gemmatimonadota bacterium]|nr:ABC transporter permease [Gemmatimonadota bacterium]
MTGLRAIHRKVLRDLWHLRSQMLAVAVVMACGIAMFVTLRSMHGWLRGTMNQYYSEYRFADVFANARRVPETVGRELAAIPGVAGVRTRVVMDVTLDLPGLDEPGTGRLVGIPEHRTPILNDLYLKMGRYLTPGRPDEVLASDAFARANGLRVGDSIAAVIHGRWQRLRIVGIALSPEFVYEIRGVGDIFPDNRRFGVLWIGERALGAAFEMEGAFNDVALALAPGASEADVIEAVDDLLTPFGGTGAYGRADHFSHLFLSSEIEETQVTSVMIPTIFLGVTAFLLQMVLARLVATQRDQIAVLKAFGYPNSAVAAHYLQLGLGPVLVGAAVGTGLGIWLAVALARVYTRFFQFPVTGYDQDWTVVGVAFLVSGGAALVGAAGAVRRAVRLPPAEAMRPEAPAEFRRGIVERLGLQRLVPAAQRIILRNVERRPVKASLSIVGIGLATAIMMVGWYMFDVMDVMKEIQFQQVQRYDLMVVFHTPQSAAARWELTRLDGVRTVEPFRAAPVRLRAGYRARRTSIVGLTPGSELQRLVDRNRAMRDVPRGGLLLSDIIAARLGVRAGDSVTVEVLEGKRPVRRMLVASVMEDIIG